MSVSIHELKPEHFKPFFEELYGYEPFPWQCRFLDALLDGKPPRVMDLPTGSGKTAIIEVWAFALAIQAELAPADRTVAMRLFYVVDRRIVVDEADRRASRLAIALDESIKQKTDDQKPIVQRVASRLQSIAASDGRDAVSPLQSHTLRGGFYRTNTWGSSLVQPMVVTSTVDQVGSRLLFRGYGVTPTAQPIQAALVGTDSLIVLDEAHTSVPFAETLDAVVKLQRHAEQSHDQPIVKPLRLLEMTATPREADDLDPDDRFELDPEIDLADDESPLVMRYRTSKLVRLDVANGVKGTRATKKLADDLYRRLRKVTEDDTSESIAIATVVNRVSTARHLYEKLRTAFKDKAEVHLMIGSMRPIDRDTLGHDLSSKIATGVQRKLTKPLIVVATQCLEVGADLDFDYMICEAASLAALRQRFGRLNRGGREATCGGDVVIREDQLIDESKIQKLADGNNYDADPIYGLSLVNTYRYLDSISSPGNETDTKWVDFGLQAMDAHVDLLCDDKQAGSHSITMLDMSVPPAETACLLPVHIDLFAQTYVFYDDAVDDDRKERIAVHPDPDVSLFLHGRQRRQLDVNVCWRADLCQSNWETTDDNGNALPKSEQKIHLRRRGDQECVTAISELPPSSAECMTVSLSAIRDFLLPNKKRPVDDSDQPMVAGDEADIDDQIAYGRRPVVWRGKKDSFVCVHPRQLRPGDTVVFPVSAGGWDSLGHIPTPLGLPFDPATTEADLLKEDQLQVLKSIDVGDSATFASTWKPVYRGIAWYEPTADFRELLQCFDSASKVSDDEKHDLVTRLPWPSEKSAIHRWLKTIWNETDGAKSDKDSTKQTKQWRSDFVFERRRGTADDDRAGWIIRFKGDRLTRNQVRAAIDGDIESPTPGETFEDDNSETIGTNVGLSEHCESVRVRTKAACSAIGLSEDESKSLIAAAALHDIGKADPRQQALLYQTSLAEVRTKPQLIAKSKRGSHSLAEYEIARKRAELPRGFRHEMMTSQVVESAGLTANDLQLHAQESHHGWARPWMPACGDFDPPDISLHSIDLDVSLSAKDRNEAADTELRVRIADRFWKLHRLYGAWGLAYLETILRLSDQQVSAEESQGKIGTEKLQWEGKNREQQLTNLHRVDLPGLEGSNPSAFLASLGLLSLVNRDSDGEAVRMHWEVLGGGWRPVLTSTKVIDRDWLESLFEKFVERPLPLALASFDEGREPDGQFAKAAGKIIADPKRFRKQSDLFRQQFLDGQLSRQEIDLVAALGSDGVRKQLAGKDTDSIDFSQLYMTRGSGHQRMLELMRNVHDAVTHSHYVKALFEPWTYDDLGRGLNYRWDPADESEHALRWKDPSKDSNMTVLGANDLAIEALVYFPTAVVDRRIATTGFGRHVMKDANGRRRGRDFFSWPIWTHPLSQSVIRSLLAWSELHRRAPNASTLAGLGVVQIQRSERKRNDKFFNFSIAEAV